MKTLIQLTDELTCAEIVAVPETVVPAFGARICTAEASVDTGAGVGVGAGVAMATGVGVDDPVGVELGVGLGTEPNCESIAPISGAGPPNGRPTLTPASMHGEVDCRPKSLGALANKGLAAIS